MSLFSCQGPDLWLILQEALKLVDDLVEKKARLGPAAALFLDILRLSILLAHRPESMEQIKCALVEKKAEVDALSGLMDT
jgi:hypothetical protein